MACKKWRTSTSWKMYSKTKGWDHCVKEDIINVVVLRARSSGEKRFELMPRWLNEDRKVESIAQREPRHVQNIGRKAPPPRWSEQTIVNAAPWPTRKEAVEKLEEGKESIEVEEDVRGKSLGRAQEGHPEKK